MSDALDILNATRDALAKKIADAVISEGDEFVESFIDSHYSTSVNEVLEMGERLWQLNRLIESMPIPPSQVSGGYTVFDAAPPVPNDLDIYLNFVKNHQLNQAAAVFQSLTALDFGTAQLATARFDAALRQRSDAESKFNELRATDRWSVASALVTDLFGLLEPTSTRVYTAIREHA